MDPSSDVNNEASSIDLSRMWRDKYYKSREGEEEGKESVFNSRIEDFETSWYPVPGTDTHLLLKHNPNYQANVSIIIVIA